MPHDKDTRGYATALYCAAARALTPGLDPFAAAMAGKRGPAYFDEVAEALGPLGITPARLALSIAERTRWIDDALLRKAESAPQVVLVGCGADSRSLRLPPSMPSMDTGAVVFFEVDGAACLAHRREVLGPATERRGGHGVVTVAVEADLRNPEHLVSALLSSGFRPDIESVFVLEGVLMYLSAGKSAELLGHLARLACVGSVILGSVVTPTALTSPAHQRGAVAWKSFGMLPFTGHTASDVERVVAELETHFVVTRMCGVPNLGAPSAIRFAATCVGTRPGSQHLRSRLEALAIAAQLGTVVCCDHHYHDEHEQQQQQQQLVAFCPAVATMEKKKGGEGGSNNKTAASPSCRGCTVCLGRLRALMLMGGAAAARSSSSK